MKIKPEEIDIKFKFNEKGKTVATATITMLGLEIRGFRVVKTKFKDNIGRYAFYPPARSIGAGKYSDVVRMPDKDDWKKFTGIVLERFEEEYARYYMVNSVGAVSTPSF